jgi:hypothetical protein
LARKHYADAERLIADGAKRYPSYAGWADLSRRLADARRATPAQTGNAPMPTQQAAPPAPAAPGAAPAPAQTANPQLARLVAAARDAIKRLDFTSAEREVAEAEKIDAKATSVIEVRAELKAAEDKAKTAPASPPPASPPPRRN